MEELSTALMEWAREQRGATLAAHEEAVVARVRAAMPRLLEEVVRASTPGLDGRHAPLRERCPECGERQPAVGWRTRTVLTVCGSVTIERLWYACRRCSGGWSPTDAVLEIGERQRMSVGVRKRMVRLGAATDFREAAELLRMLTGMEVSPETVRQHTERAGREIVEAEMATARETERTRAPVGAVDMAPGTLLVETDGVQVRYIDGWHEVKVGLAAGCIEGEVVAPTYVAARADPETFGSRLLAVAAARGALDVVAWQGGLWEPALAVLRPVVVLGDGAPWIWNLAAEHFGDRTEIVDAFHAVQHVWELAHALHGRDSPEAQSCAHAWRRVLIEEGADALLQSWHHLCAPTPAAAEIVRRTRHYVRTNAARMRYPLFRAQGLPIGSGPVESAGKHLVQARLKRPGARWSEPGAAALLALRARNASSLPKAA